MTETVVLANPVCLKSIETTNAVTAVFNGTETTQMIPILRVLAKESPRRLIRSLKLRIEAIIGAEVGKMISLDQFWV